MVDDSARTRKRGARTDPRAAVRTAVVWDALDSLLRELVEATGRSRLDVVDLGGGTGGFAVPIAGLGHGVTVVDPSPDALAALQRRVHEADLASHVRAEQGDAATLAEVVGERSADLVLCHGVLEYVDDPGAAAAAALAVLRPGGMASILVAQRLGAVLARALSGRFAEALRLLDAPDGSAGGADPVPRRFDEPGLRALLAGQSRGVAVRQVHGVRLVTDLLPGALVDGDPDAAESLLALERAASDHPSHPQLASLAAQLHVVVQVDPA